MNGPAPVAFRFDIDTLTCIETGVPALLQLAKSRSVRFSFFANMGRSFSWSASLSGIRRSSSTPVAPKASRRQKLGWRNLIRTVGLNPPIGAGHRSILQSVVDQGHELGLHGGKNHARWQYGVRDYTDDELQQTLEWSHGLLCEITEPQGFTSPGFATDPRTYPIVKSMGYRYVSDTVGRGLEPTRTDDGLIEIPASVTGPGDLAPLESLWASGLTAEQVVDSVCERADRERVPVIYGHPCFDGHLVLDLFTEVLDRLMDQRPVATLAEIVEPIIQAEPDTP